MNIPAILKPGESPISVDSIMLLLAELEHDAGLKIGTLAAVKAAKVHAAEAAKLQGLLNTMVPAERGAAIELAAQKMAEGKLQAGDLASATLEVDAKTDFHGSGRKIVARAVELVSNMAYAELRGVDWVSLLRPGVASAVKEITERGTLIPEDAGRVDLMPPEGSVARQSWYATLEAVERLNVLWRAYGNLLWNGIIKLEGHVTVPFEDFIWEHPERLPRAAATDIRFMLDAISAGAGPTILAQAELPVEPGLPAGNADARTALQIADDLAYETNLAAGVS